jgi:hypothetical protein
MPNRYVWIAFLLICFLVTGLTGLFASYAPSIPLERAIHRAEALDPQARTQALADGLREADAVGNRTRLMLGVVTVLAAGLGSGILLLAAKDARR